jgi:hypothetical protein
MATLTSPGVSVTVSDESFYAPAGSGSVPLIVIATAQDKASPDGSGISAYTTSATAGKLYQVSSQRELLQNYGNPVFKSSGLTQLHGNEQNEYGLLSAYSFLGIANSAYVLRADIDLNDLTASASAPTSKPANGSYWLDTSSSVIGVKKWDGSNWVKQTVKVPASNDLTTGDVPKASYGIKDDFAVVYFNTAGATKADIKVYQKTSDTNWDVIGDSGWTTRTSSADFQIGDHSDLPSTRQGGGSLVSGDIFLQQNSLSNGTDFKIKLYNSGTGLFTDQTVYARKAMSDAFGSSYHGASPVVGDLFVDVAGVGQDNDYAWFTPKRHNGNSSISAESSSALDGSEVVVSAHATKVSMILQINDGSNINVTFSTDTDSNGNASVDDMVIDINTAIAAADANATNSTNVIASNNSGKLKIENSDGKDILLMAGNVSGFGPAQLNLTADVPYSNFEALSFTASATELTGSLADGMLWYDASVSTSSVDLLYNNAGSWATYTGDVQVKSTQPTAQSDAGSLQTGDIWIDGSDLENYPKIYKYSSANEWVLVDNKDQLTPAGIVFGDFRASSSGALISEANGLPSPTLYPSNILAWNKMASGGNVKKYDSASGLWKDFSGNKADGSPHMLRKAQRKVVVTALQSANSSNQDIRNETNRFNIVAVPGYPELADEMVSLGTDRKNTVFSVIDAPLRLAADATSTSNWINNNAVTTENGEDGLVSSSPYAAVYYPHGLSSNLDGSSVMVPASHMALRTLAFNDQVAFPWFAPAGFQRGLVNNASGTGYLDSVSNEFVPVALSEGQRDSLYTNKMNPIGNFPGRGIAVFGQKTLNPVSSALDRVNVARLVVYLREQLDDAVKPFLFEPNDEVTRANAKVVVDRLLGELVSQRGLFDFVTVCDTTNNTAARIDRNELHIDVAIQPVKAVEFIYIPIRIQNTLGQTG